MGKYCLIGKVADKFKKKLANGEINPEKLAEMTSAERHKTFRKFMDEENATNVNSLFEKKMLQKYKWNAYMNWAKELTGIKPAVKRDLVSRIQKMADDPESILNAKTEEAFLKDLASTRLGMGITFEETQQIVKLANNVTETKTKMNPDTFRFKTDKDKLEYGISAELLRRYTGDLKNEALKLRLKDFKPGKIIENPRQYARNVAHVALVEVGGVAKSMVASIDNSFHLRQGLWTMLNSPKIWAKRLMQSWGVIGKELKGEDAMLLLQADLHSRENVLNGLAKRAKLAIDIGAEEAFPSSLPERIPLFGRLFKASESAYNGSAMMTRMDLFDQMIKTAKKNGLDVHGSDDLLRDYGSLANSMTGRGGLSKLEPLAKELNVALFSAKFLSSNWNKLTAHSAGLGLRTTEGRKIAAKNLVRGATQITGLLVLADTLYPGSVEWDPTSSNFGKIKIKNTTFDVTGGMGSIVTLMAREATGKSKSSTTGIKEVLGEKYGSRTQKDVAVDFLLGKASPIMRAILDRAEGRTFGGEKPTAFNLAKNMVTPIIIQNYFELKKDPNSAGVFWGTVFDGMGISTNTMMPGSAVWENTTGKELNQFKETIGVKEFEKANEKYNLAVSEQISALTKTKEYKALPADEQRKKVGAIKREVKKGIFEEHNFKYKKESAEKIKSTSEYETKYKAKVDGAEEIALEMEKFVKKDIKKLPDNTLLRIATAIKKKLFPEAVRMDEKEVKRKMKDEYEFTDEAKKDIKDIRVGVFPANERPYGGVQYNPERRNNFTVIADLFTSDKFVIGGVLNTIYDKGVELEKEGKTKRAGLLFDIAETLTTPAEYLYDTPSKIMVQDEDKESTTAVHETLHAIFDKKYYPAGRRYELGHEDKILKQMERDWNKAKKSKLTKEQKETMEDTDMILETHIIYADRNEYSIGTERFAFLGEKLGKEGLESIPEPLRKYYKGVFK